MADDFKPFSDGERSFLRTVIGGFRQSYADESSWVNRLEAALDDADYWRSRASKPTVDDSELAGELELRKEECSSLCALVESIYAVCRKVGFEQDDGDELRSVQQLADALTAERAKSAALQHQLETVTAASASHEPVGWVARDVRGVWVSDDGEIDGPSIYWGGAVPCDRRRRVYLGPAEPLEVPK